MANYPADDPSYRPAAPPAADAQRQPVSAAAAPASPSPTPQRAAACAPAGGERITVTRAAAQRSREMGSRMYWLVQRAATADGADKSGLTALTWPVVANFATDAAMAVALANTLFFAAATGESKDRVALYLLITIAPFAVIAPLIGPALGPAAARPPGRAGRVVRAAHRAGGGADHQLRRRHRQLSRPGCCIHARWR